MKIAFLSTFYPFRGGIAQFNAALFRALEEGHDVKAFNFTVQYPKFLFPGKTQFVEAGDKADKIITTRILSSINPISYQKTVKEIKAFEPDVLIIGYWMPYMAPSLGFVAKKMAKYCKVVSIVHNAIPHERGKLDKYLTNYFFKHNNQIIALSEAVKTDIEKQYPKLNVNVLPHPVYEHFGDKVEPKEALNQLQLESHYTYVLFFGLIRDYKGLDVLLLALKELDNDVHLIIAGEVYGSFEKYQDLINTHQLEDRVHLYLRYIPDEEVKYYFSASNAVVLPYKSGTQSGIIAIAKHFSTPIVTTDVGGFSEFIKGNEGKIVAPNDDVALAEGIKSILQLGPSKIIENKQTNSWSVFAKNLLSKISSSS